MSAVKKDNLLTTLTLAYVFSFCYVLRLKSLSEREHCYLLPNIIKYVCWLVFVNLQQMRITREGGTSTEELPSSNCLWASLWDAF